ncbi:hypothetical protein HJC23_008491 [Cyclotella cryptica]|uniref:Uncharacterized protein n=1 Tax=Cyclotella cryptica TaxID=29204 RepID=A0ABD3QY21_9STRA
MAPLQPQSAYHLYFRFYKNVLLRPSLRTAVIHGDKTNREQYKDFVQSVLDVDLNDSSLNSNTAQQKFIGNESFAGMSKDVSKKWKEVDPLTRSIFKELAAEDSKRYKKVSSFTLWTWKFFRDCLLVRQYRPFEQELFDSYQSFTKSHTAPIPALHIIDSVRDDGREKEIECVQVGVTSPSNAACYMQSYLGLDDNRAPSEVQMNQGHVNERETAVASIHKQSNDIWATNCRIWSELHMHQGQAFRESSASAHAQGEITEVDMNDEEIISMAITIWGLCPCAMRSVTEEDRDFVSNGGINSFLSGIDWNAPSY